MKKQQKLQHQCPSRESARLSSFSTSASFSAQLSDEAKSGPTTRPDDAWALSLHVAEQQSLEICYPSPEEEISLRRSSRFTTKKYKTVSPEKSRSKRRRKDVPAFIASQLRRSPRFFSSSSAPALILTDGENVGSGESGSKKRRHLSEVKETGRRVGKKAKTVSGERSLRRSLRLSGGENGNLSLQLLALPEPGSKQVSKRFLSEKCLRSRTVLVHVGDEKAKSDKMDAKKNCGDFSLKEKCLRSRVVKYALIESPEVSEKRAARSDCIELPSVEESNFTEKCLRSRTVKMQVGNEKEKAAVKNVTKKGAGNYALIELSPDPETRKSRSSFRRSAMLSREVDESPKLEMLTSPEENASSSEKCLRLRTVKMQVGNEKEKAGKNASKKSVGDCASIELPQDHETRKLRNGFRTSTTLNWEVDESPKLEMLALSEKNPSSSEKCLRSRNVKMQVGNEKEKAGKNASNKNSGDYSLVELPKDPETRKLRSSFKSCAMLNGEVGESPKLEMLALPEKNASSSEKCLRSRTVNMQVENEKEKVGKNATKKSAGDFALIGLPQAPETRKVKGSFWRSTLDREVGESPKLEMLALPEERMVTGASVKSAAGVLLNEKRSMTHKIESSVDDLPDVSEKRDNEKCDSETLSEKCLRSRKIRFKVNVDDAEETADQIKGGHASSSKRNAQSTVKSEKKEKSVVCCLIGEPFPEEVAQKRWQWRYDLKSREKGKSWKINADEEDEIILNVDCHYAQAKVGSFVLDIGDCVFVKGEGKKKHIGRILEFFRTMEGEDYFRVQWFFRAEDTVLKDAASLHDNRRLFYSTLMNDNILDCIISKVNVVKIPPMLRLKPNPIQSAAFYYDMEYCIEYSTFRTLVTDSQSFLLNSKQPNDELITLTQNYNSSKQELALLDLYSGCGGMSTGLCLGAKLSSVNLMTKWAVDYNSSACDSLKMNHPETKVRNESAEDFLDLLNQWQNLCKLYMSDTEGTLKYELEEPPEAEDCMTQLDTEVSSGEYEVSYLVDICYGDPSERGKRGLHFKVRWKGYHPDDDTWEPIEGLSNCRERIQEFVRKGFNSKILPLPGDVDIICGGPPCQGISGYNRYRNFDSPLADERNRQIVVFMDIVEFLKPRYVLMENVVDIIKFDNGSLGRYALSRLVLMKYQARLGTMASGCYGLPQFRLRVFIWGAHPTEMLPQFPLPTHDVVVKYWPPLEFERNIVAYDEGQPRTLEDAIVLGDSISDLPAVKNNEFREEMAYKKPPETEFQNYIRLRKDAMMGRISTTVSQAKSSVLYDHRPLQLSEHDYLRVCQIPHRKGANFRDLPGIIVGEDNVARRDPTKEPVMLPTGRPLVPDCVLSFEQGKSRRPYARLWWDETVSTVVTFPHLRAQAILHPEQDRLLTIRECARLQGFPDYYRFCGTTKERYCQIGNAVSIPVARALGYALGMAYQQLIGDEPLMRLQPKFSSQLPFD